MGTTEAQRSLLALCAMKVQRKSIDWSLIAREAQLDGGLDALWEGEFHERSAMTEAARATLRQGIRYRKTLLDRVDKELAAASSVGASLITVLDDTYPSILRLSPNLPPFLFVRGDITPDDARSVAVIGPQDGSPSTIRTAQRVSELLADRRVTVVSGCEERLDRAVHQTMIDSGWRTLAVLGTGITTRPAPEIRDLADSIEQHGALISPFWPTHVSARDSTPRRHVITSELSQGTVIVETPTTSRARIMARIAREQGKKVFVLKSLITKHNWARNLVAKRGVLEVGHVDEIVAQLALPERVKLASAQRRQLTLGLL